MDTMTTTDYQIEEDYQTNYEANKMQAKIEFYIAIEPIKQKFEHLLNDDALVDTPYSTYALFVKSVEKMKEMALFDFIDADDNIIEYNLTNDLRIILLDEYGWEL
jgi:hypothetical protein